MTDQFSNVTFAYDTWIHPTLWRDVCCNSCQCLMKQFMVRVSTGSEVYGTSSVGGSVTKEVLMKWSPTPRALRLRFRCSAHSAAAAGGGMCRHMRARTADAGTM